MKTNYHQEKFISSNKKYIFNCNKCKSELKPLENNIVRNTCVHFVKNKTEFLS
jgi:hypothetical protein